MIRRTGYLPGLFLLLGWIASPRADVPYLDPVYPVQVTPGIVYGQGAVQGGASVVDLRLDLYEPVGWTATNRPAVVLVHGGSFSSGTRTSPDMVQAGSDFASRGWICASISYRLSGDNPPAPFWIAFLGDPQANAAHAAAVDTKKAVRWLRAHAATYGIDPTRVAGLGHSAGAFAVLMAAVTDPQDFANDAGTPIPDTHPEQSGRLDLCLEISGDVALWDTDVDPSDPPLFIWHGTADTTVPFASAEYLASLCASNQVDHVFLPVPGVEHGAPTWLGQVDGRALLDHAREFMTTRWELHTRARVHASADRLHLAWTRQPHGQFWVEADARPDFPAPHILAGPLPATNRTMNLHLPPPPQLTPYLRLRFDTAP